MTISTRTSYFTDETVPHTYRVEPDLEFHAFEEISVFNEPDIEIDCNLVCTFDPDLERYTVFNVNVRRRPDKPEISSAQLRKVKVQEFVRRGLLGPALKTNGIAITDAEAQRLRDLGPSDDSALLAITRIYKVAYAVQGAPAKLVEQALQLSTPTASHWIRRARDRGILEEPFQVSFGSENIKRYKKYSDLYYEDWADGNH